MDEDSRHHLIQIGKWVSIYLLIGIVVSLVVPFPYSVIIFIIIVLAVTLMKRTILSSNK